MGEDYVTKEVNKLASKHLMALLVLCLVLVWGSAWAQATIEEVVADCVANSGVFPAGTTVVSTIVDGESVTVELSADALNGLGEEVADAMSLALNNALNDFGITALEITVGGQPLWTYLPQTVAGAASTASAQTLSTAGTLSGIGGIITEIPDRGGGGGEGADIPVLTTELAGKGVGLYNSHGAYWDERSQYRYWRPAMRTLCGPNPEPPRPPGWSGSVYQPSNYYYWTRGFQWGSYYEDYRTDQEIRFLRAYLKSSGAIVCCGRNLDKNAGFFDYNKYGYPNCSFPLYKWITAAKYHLQEIGAPEAVWNEPTLTSESDKDIRARPYWTNYNMIGKWPLTPEEIEQVRNNPGLWENWVSIHLHTNAAGSGQGRGTETYWYTSKYPWLQTKAVALANAFNTAIVNAIRTKYDGYWAEDPQMYGYTGANPPEWPSGVGNWVGYAQTSPPSRQWANRGVKTSNFGEIREALMPAVLTELLFHDDWKFYPDHVFSLDRIFSATVAWGMYEGICNYFGVTPKPRLAATVQSVSFPTLVGPNAPIEGTVVMRNEGQAWCWGNKWVNKVYFPYTVWKLAPTANNQLGGDKIPITDAEPIYPGQLATFKIKLTSPATTGLYTTEWRMVNDGAFGGAFGQVATAQIQVDADPPVITIASPAPADYPYGCIKVEFSATDELSSVASITADIDGEPVTSGQNIYGLALGAHTLTVTASDIFGNTATQTVTFNVVNSIGKTTAGGWIELEGKKATCGFVSEYVEGSAAPAGSVTYQDHDTGMTVKSISLVAMGIVGNRAWIYGTCEIDNQPGHWFRIDVTDNGEPGSDDVFNILLDTGYQKGGKLGGGNITIH